MSESRVDYSELVFALRKHRGGEASELAEELLYRLKDYLKVVLNANEADAAECTQQAFINVYDQIMQDNIKEEKYIFSYLIRSCRHEYFRLVKDRHKFDEFSEDHTSHFVEPARQIDNLIDEERMDVLQECLNELQDKSRKFIEYFMEEPDSTTKQASKHFGISGANVRTKKSRILKRLQHCFKRKWKK